MKKALLLLAGCFVSCLLMLNFTGCTEANKNKDKITKFLYRYGDVTAEEMYKNANFKSLGATFDDFDRRITSVDIKNINSKDDGPKKLYFVKVKMSYRFTNKKEASAQPILYDRYMALTIAEDGFEKMLVNSSESHEIFVAGFDEKSKHILYENEIKSGETLIN